MSPDRRFVDLFWRLVLTYPERITPPIKERIVSTVWTRISRFKHRDTSKPVFRLAPRQIFDPVLRKHVRVPVDIAQICAALSTHAFPALRASMPLPLEVQQWALQEARAAFSPQLSAETRWHSVLLLALYHRPDLLHHTIEAPIAVENVSHVDWHTIFILALLHSMSISPSESELIFGITRSLWQNKGENRRPIFVTRVMVATFFQLSAITKDGPLLDDCYRYCTSRDMWTESTDLTALGQSQTKALTVGYAIAMFTCKGKFWGEIINNIAAVSSDMDWLGDIMGSTIAHFLPGDIQVAYDVYLNCVNKTVPISPLVAHALSIALVPSQCSIAIPFLLDSRFSAKQSEQLLGSILRFFQEQRTHFLDASSGRIIAQCFQRVYKWHLPARTSLKYPIRWAIPLLVDSGQSSSAVTVLEALYIRKPSLFSVRYILRVLSKLIRHRKFRLAVRLSRLTEGWPSISVDYFRKKLMFALARADARNLAQEVHRTLGPRALNRRREPGKSRKRKVLRSTAEVMARRVGFRPNSPRARQAKQSLAMLTAGSSSPSSIKYAFMLLINAKRTVLARRLFQQSLQQLDPKTKTWMGNLYLHKSFIAQRARFGDLVRKVLRARAFLIARFGFADDRVTLNIIIKALLHWHRVCDSYTIKVLFDHLVRQGYPASRYPDGPFQTLVSSVPEPALSGLPASLSSSPINFRAHVRPLYKMFIRAFYARKDVAAARVVVGILHTEEALAVRRLQVMSRARMLGVRKAKEAARKSGD